MDIFYITLEQIIKFSIMICIGFASVKGNVFKQDSLDVISRFIMRVLIPVFILYNITSGATRADVLANFYVLPLSLAVYLTLIVLSWLMAKPFGLDLNRSKTFQAVFAFGNVGFIGIPLIVAIFPENGMVYVSLYAIIDQLMVWTYCVHLTTKDSRGITLANLRNMINPALVSILAAIIIVMTGIPIPSVIMDTMSSIGSASSPLSLIYIGACLAFYNMKHVLTQKELYFGVFIKMFLAPIAIYFLLYNGLSIPFDVSMSMAMIVALPGMVTTSMLVTINNPEQGEYCIGAVMLTHLLSMVLLPIIAYIILAVS